MNEQKDVPVEKATVERWREAFSKIQKQHEAAGETLIWVMVDGFLLYWDKVCAPDPHFISDL